MARKLTVPEPSKAASKAAKPAAAGTAAAAPGELRPIAIESMPLPFKASPAIPQLLPIDSLAPSPLNPRRRLPPNDAELTEGLMHSIAERGQLQALLARPGRFKLEGKHEIAIGFRRYRAIRLGIERGVLPADFPVAVGVRELSDGELVLAAGTENLARENMHPLDEADTYAALLPHVAPKKGERVHQLVAQAYGVSERTVHRRLALLRCAPAVQEALFRGEIDQQQALAMTLGDATAQDAMLRRLRDLAEQKLPPLPLPTIKQAMLGSRIPVEAAPFRRDLYKGEIIRDDDTGAEYFADPVEFDRLAQAVLDAKAEALRRKWRWVEVCEGEFEKLFAGRDHDGRAIDPKDAEAGAVVCYERGRGDIEIVAPALRKSTVAQRKRAAANAQKAADAEAAKPAEPKAPPRPDDLCIAEARQVLELFDQAVRAGDADKAAAMRERMEEIGAEMNGGDSFGMAATVKRDGGIGGMVRLARALAAPAGAVPLFGQPGEFEIGLPTHEDCRAVEGTSINQFVPAVPDDAPRARVATEGLFEIGGWGFELHAIDPAQLFINSTGFRSFLSSATRFVRPGITVPEWIVAAINNHMRTDDKGKTAKKRRPLVPLDEQHREMLRQELADERAEPETEANPEPPITPADLRKASEAADEIGEIVHALHTGQSAPAIEAANARDRQLAEGGAAIIEAMQRVWEPANPGEPPASEHDLPRLLRDMSARKGHSLHDLMCEGAAAIERLTAARDLAQAGARLFWPPELADVRLPVAAYADVITDSAGQPVVQITIGRGADHAATALAGLIADLINGTFAPADHAEAGAEAAKRRDDGGQVAAEPAGDAPGDALDELIAAQQPEPEQAANDSNTAAEQPAEAAE